MIRTEAGDCAACPKAAPGHVPHYWKSNKGIRYWCPGLWS